MKVLLTGLGSIGQRHARNLRLLLGRDVELTAYRSRGLQQIIAPDVQSTADGDPAAHYGIRCCASLRDGLDEQPDVVFVTNPNAGHVAVALAAAEAGCHLFIEKPLSHSLDGVAELAASVARRQLVCLVGYQLRFHPALIAVQQWLSAGVLGRLLGARFVFGEPLPDWHPYEDFRGSFMSRRAEGGGVILTQVHDLDCLYALFGLPFRMFAVGGHLSGLPIDAEDTASILMECRIDGRPLPVHVHQDCVSGPRRRAGEIIGEHGRIAFDFEASTAEHCDNAGRIVDSVAFNGYPRNNLFLDELRHLFACLRREAQPIVGLADAVQSLRMALAAQTSIETRQNVDVI